MSDDRSALARSLADRAARVLDTKGAASPHALETAQALALAAIALALTEDSG